MNTLGLSHEVISYRYDKLIGMQYAHYFETKAYKVKLNKVISQMPADHSVSRGSSFSIQCGSDILCAGQLLSSNEYWAKEIACRVPFRRYAN